MDENDDCNVFIDINNNQCKELSSEDEKEEDKECHAMVHEESSSCHTSNDLKSKRVEMKSNVDEIKVNISNDKNQEIKVNISNVDENENEEDV